MVALYLADGAEMADVPAAERRWAHHLSLTPSMLAYVGGELVGFALTERMSRDVLLLSNLLVSAPHRARGIGGDMLSALVAEAVVGGFAAVFLANSELVVRPGKRSAASFYRRHDFTEVLNTGPTTVYLRRLTHEGDAEADLDA